MHPNNILLRTLWAFQRAFRGYDDRMLTDFRNWFAWHAREAFTNFDEVGTTDLSYEEIEAVIEGLNAFHELEETDFDVDADGHELNLSKTRRALKIIGETFFRLRAEV